MGENERKKQNTAPPDSPPQENAGTEPTNTRKQSEIIPMLMGLLIVFGPLFYFLVWRRLEWATSTKGAVFGSIAAIILLIYIFLRARKVRVFELVSNFVIILFIVLGAAISSIFLTLSDQTVVFKLFVIGFFSFFPAWLYLQFISIKGKTLWDEYVLNLYRLHVDNYGSLPMPPEQSLFYSRWSSEHTQHRPRDKTIYEKKFEGLFGPVYREGSSAFAVFRGENLWPVAIATLIISVGWVLVVAKPSISLPLGGWRTWGAFTDLPLEVFRFAFLGAYFYILQMLVRRYFQNDLKTSAYVNATMRIVVVILLVWALDLVLKDKATLEQRSVLAFVIGVFPYVGWQALRALTKLPLKLVVPSLRQPYPLSDLDGLNIWYESRLLEEGIEDMQNLATANLVDVMLNTRIPVERLVDWVDQSLLFLHLGKDGNERHKSSREKLRRFGIRTATDLKDALNSRAVGNRETVQKLEYLLNRDENEPSVLRCIVATFKDEPNLFHIQEWKAFAERDLRTRP